jgi:hypothetical protein
MQQLPDTFHEGRAVIEWLKPHSFPIIPEILEEKDVVLESPVMPPEQDVLRTVILNLGECPAA